jgi:hypothetical protein
MRTSFYTYFTSGYGTLWFAMFAVSFVTDSQVQAGEFGYYGFPIIAVIYAFYRRTSDANKLRAETERVTAPDA